MRSIATPKHRSPHAGFALILVLSFLALITILVLAFFSSVTTEYAATKSYADGASTKQLADTAAQIVMGQIKTATSGTNLAWASQPGMIRTYDNTGAAATNYKLYSSDTTTTSGALTFAQVSDFDTSWSTKTSLWTDLNAPVADSTGIPNFPIVDGNNIKSLTKDAAGNTVTAYLGYDANGDGLPDVQGFSVDPSKVSYNAAVAVSGTNTPVPVPVKWLYQLRDGTLTAADTTSTTTATFVNAANKPSAANPIIARVAFWTDDESSKVNINTAGEGTYWDTPHFNSATYSSGAATSANASQFPDYAYAAFQPALYEFQRYPGHPAQVALSSIFSGTLGQNMAGITPRLVWGGSQGGTIWAGGATAKIDLSKAPRQALYASVDELMFAGAPSPTPSTTRPTNQLPATLTKAQLEQAKFFITANSRAPEVNLFNKPRVAIWPIHKDLATNPASPYTTAYDRLIAFCSTLRPDLGSSAYRYYFQRGDAQSPIADYGGNPLATPPIAGIPRNVSLYSYLQSLTSQKIPGFGGDFLQKYSVGGVDVGERDQILTEIFDYIRCTNLSDPSLGGIPPSGTWAKSTYQYANYQNTTYNPVNNDEYCGQVMPIQIGSTMGFGRYYTVKDVSMVFACLADGKAGTPTTPIALLATDPDFANQAIIRSSNDVTAAPALVNVPLAPTEKRFQMALLLNYFHPSPGQLKCGPDMLVRISNLDQISITGATNIDGASLFPAAPTASGWVGKLLPSPYSGYNPVDSVEKVRFQFIRHRSPLYYRATYASLTNGRIIYPFVSRAFTLTSGGTLALASPVTLKIELFQANSAYDSNDGSLSSGAYNAPGAPTYAAITSDPTKLIQTINVTFPAGTFPQPTLPTSATVNGLYTAGPPPVVMSPQGAWGFDGRIASPYYFPQQTSAIVAQDGVTSTMYDTVRTVSVQSGDARTVAATNVVPASLFSVGNTTTYNDASGSTLASKSFHYLQDNGPPLGGQSGKLVPGIGGIGLNSNYPVNTEVNYCKYGDWDGPLVRTGAGAFINKPDEGDNNDLGGGGTSNIPYYGFNESTVKNINLYTPNRLVPSPGMFGSLPTGVKRNLPWQTLLFRPQSTHPNFSTTAPDHLLMDLFWMPVVEPYAISEPFSTAGKINLNYQLAPFTYITRSTAMVSLLKNEKMAARPISVDQPTSATTVRLDINPSENGGTLQQFAAKFGNGGLFRSATEICDMDLVPYKDPAGAAQTWSSSWGSNFWQANANTGDNLRERPYANLYARLTTKSNSFTVHFRVQSLKKSSGTQVDQWVQGRDQITAEYRGSSLIERYIDASDPTLPDFATNSSAVLDTYYKFRVVSTKKFAP